MAHKQTLFSATFEEARRFVPNMFTNKSSIDHLEALESNKFIERFFVAITMIPFGTIICMGLGLGMTWYSTNNADDLHFITIGIHQGIIMFNKIQPIVIFSICLPIFFVVLNLLPVKNYAYRRLLAVPVIISLVVEVLVCVMPLFLGVSLGALGWLGFTIGHVYGITFFLKMMKANINDMKDKLYHRKSKKHLHQLDTLENHGIDKLWSILKKYSLVVLGIIIVNILIFRIGMWGERTIWSIWGIGVLIYWLIVTGFSSLILPMFIRTFYFVKYAEQYRQLWKATDEQWYGPRKARRLAKKRINDK